MKKDRNLLFGMLAVSMKKVRPDKLAEHARQTQSSPDADLGQSLVAAGLLSQADKEQLDSLVEMSLNEHAGDASATIQDFGKNPEKISTLVDSLDDFLDAFERNSANPPNPSVSDFPADSLLGNVGTAGSETGDLPMELDSLLEPGDLARTRITHSGNTNDRGSVGDIARGDAPDSFFESLGSPDTQIMSPVQAAAELDESEIVPAVAEHKGRYETIREFAKGGMGQITLVHDTHLGRDVALKQLLQRNILPETRPGAPTTAILTIPIIARFLQEARVTGQLEHPSIIPVYELGYRADGSLYYTMKLIRGQSMHDFLKDAKDIRDRLTLLTHFLNLCQAISYAHSRGVIHRDLKPMNIMIGEFGETVLIDWGIAKVKGQDDIHAKGLQETFHAMRVSSTEATAKTMYGQTIGSPYFMPAEQAMGRTDLIDERSDIYSLGAVLYVILTGQMPYAGNNVREFMGKVGQVEPRPVRELEPQAPPELAAIVKKAMALVPENRYQSAKELTAEIEKFISGGQVSAYDYSMVEIAKRYYKKHRTRINTLAGAAVVLLVLGAYSYISIRAQKVIAEEQRDIAEIKKQEAEVAKVEAEEQKGIAVVERDNAQQQLYYANIANTKFNISEQQMAKARELLASCEPASLRQWEWGHLQAETHADLITLDRGGRFTAFTADGTGLITATAKGTVTLYDLATGQIGHEFVNRAGSGTAVAASDNASFLAVRGDESVQVWDAGTREEIIHYDEVRKTEERHHLALSPNGKYVAALNSTDSARAYTVRVWDLASREIVFSLEDCQLGGFSMVFSPDGSHLLIARSVFGEKGNERRFEVYTIPDGKTTGTYTFPAESAVSVHTAAFSPDNKSLALGTEDGLLLWDVTTFKLTKAYPGRRFYTPDLIAFSPDGTHVAAGDNDGGLTMIEVTTGKLSEVNKAHENIVRGVRFTPDGKRLASISDDRTLRLWSVPDLKPIRTFRGHDNSIYTLAVSQDGLQAATSSPKDGIAKVWDLSADLEFAPSEIARFTKAIAHPGSGLVAGSGDKVIYVWDARAGHRRHTLAAHGEPAKVIAFNSDGSLLASIGMENGTETLRVWELTLGELRYAIPTGQQNSGKVWFIENDTQLLVESGTTLARLDLAAGTNAPLFPDSSPLAGKKLLNVDVNAARTYLSAAFEAEAANTFTAVYAALSGDAAPLTLDVPEVTGVRTFFLPKEGELILCQTNRKENGGAGDATLARWDIAQNALVATAAGHTREIKALAVSNDGNLLATGSDDSTAIIWKLDDLTRLATLRGHSSQIGTLAFSPDHNRIVTGSTDLTFKIWDVATGAQILTLNNAAVSANIQVPQPQQVAFSADGLHLATITEPPVSPMILHAFSTDTATYPAAEEKVVDAESNTATESSADSALKSTDITIRTAAEKSVKAEQLEKQMEAYKRLYWRK